MDQMLFACQNEPFPALIPRSILHVGKQHRRAALPAVFGKDFQSENHLPGAVFVMHFPGSGNVSRKDQIFHPYCFLYISRIC